MVIDEHIQTACLFLEQADQEFDVGDTLQGSEKMWGAFSHAMAAFCQSREWPYGTHRNTVNAARDLASESDNPYLFLAGLAEARNFHNHFYNGSMEAYEIDVGRPTVRESVDKILELAGRNGTGDNP